MGDGPEPLELQALRAIDRFGAPGVWGRPLGVGEISRMGIVDRIVRGYQARERAENWVEWAQANPEDDALLNLAARLHEGS